MFRKAPLRTYQRKKAGGASTTIQSTSIIREDVSDKKDLQPKEFLAFKDTDQTLEYDPFDTTFDRIARDVIIPPVPPNLDDDSYSSSSNHSNNRSLDDSDAEPLPIPLPIINPKPVPLRRNSKKQKLEKDVPTVKIELKSKTRRRKYKTDSSFDENTTPNVEQKSGKKRRNIKASKELKNVVPLKKRRVMKKTVTSTHRRQRVKNFDRSKSFKNCSVNLTRVDISLNKSTIDSNSTNNFSGGEKVVVSYPNEEINQEPLVKDQSQSLGKEKNMSIVKKPTPKKLVEDQEMSLEEDNTSTFKNPTVSLTRLNIPDLHASIANKLWFNSTPMTTKTMRHKSSLHISPITTDKSMETTDHDERDIYESPNLTRDKQNVQSKYSTRRKSKSSNLMKRTENAPLSNYTSLETTDRNEDDGYKGQNLPSEERNAQSNNLTPKKIKTTRFSNRNKLNEKRSTKIKPLLSDSPDPEPSGLMFDDTEMIASADPHASLEKSGNINATDASTISPFLGFPKYPPEVVVADSAPGSKTVLASIGNHENTMEASATSLFKGFTKDSTDSGSLHLTFYESDVSKTPSNELTCSLEKELPDSSTRVASTEDQENQIKEANNSAFFRGFEKVQQKIRVGNPKIRLSLLEKDTINPQYRSKEISKSLQNSLEVSPENLPNASKKGSAAAESTEDGSEEITQVLQNSSEVSTKVVQSSFEKSTDLLQGSLNENSEDRQDRSDESSRDPQSSLNESADDRQNSSKEQTKDLQDSSDENVKDRQSSLNESADDRQNGSQEQTKDLQESLKDKTKDLKDSSKEKTKDRLKGILKNRQSRSKKSLKTRQESLQNDSIVLQTRSKKSLRTRQSSSENHKTILNESQENRQSILDLSAYDTENVSKDIAKDWESSFDESSQNTTEQINSDGEWETTSESPKSNLSSAKSSENTGTLLTDSNKFIVQLSSDEANTSNEFVEFVNSRQSLSQTEYDSDGEKPSNFEVDKSSIVETFSQSEASLDESSVGKIPHNQKLLKNSRRNSLQPIVLLSRCSVPIKASKQVSHFKDTLQKKHDDSTKSIKDLSSENEYDDSEKSINQSRASESIGRSTENDESQESQGDMSSLKVDELSENVKTIEEATVTEVPDRDSSNESFRWPIAEVGKVSESSYKRTKDEGEESFVAAEVSTRKSLIEKTPMKILAEDTRSSIQPIVLLNRLNDPIRIGDRRRKYRNWGLSAISEDLTGKNVTTIDEEPEEFETAKTKKNETNTDEIREEPEIKLSGNGTTVISQETTVSCDASVLSNQSNASIREDKVVFLKPGKSWSRSLSLFRQVHSQDDIESLAIGKGKKWRQSVQSVLDMQQQGVIQSCIRKNADDKESRSCYGVRNSTAAWVPGSSQPNTSGVLSQTSVGSPGRFIRRISIRVVPDRKNSELYEDSPFLEAYGITSCENRKTIGKRSTLIAPRKTLVYNVKCSDVSFENIPKTPNSVTSRDVVLAQCGQDESVPFEEFYPDSYLKYCRKIGEGVFGEVFLYEKGLEKNVIKIIPIEGEMKVNGERQKKFDEILSEIVIAKELNNLRFADTCKTSSFVEVKNIRCVVGNYPPMLIDLWNKFDNEKNSENDCPAMFDKDQLYIVLELGHGGQDLEAFVFQNSSEAHALFIQTALALAVAEEALEFEHRDLHWGNILISRTGYPQINYKLGNKDISVASKGVKVSVIDFTLSRMSYQGCSIFNDLSLDDDLFAAQGEYQFEIYRLMRQKVENNWQTFEPFTNILWLHYTLDKMITAVRYRRTSTKIHKSGIDKLKVLKDEILCYKSAFDFVTNCDNVTRLQGSRSNVSTVSSTE